NFTRVTVSNVPALTVARPAAGNLGDTTLSNVIEKLTSGVVQNFNSVEIVRGLTCPACGAQLGPHALLHDSVRVTLRCDQCHADAIVCEPIPIVANKDEEEFA